MTAPDSDSATGQPFRSTADTADPRPTRSWRCRCRRDISADHANPPPAADARPSAAPRVPCPTCGGHQPEHVARRHHREPGRPPGITARHQTGTPPAPDRHPVGVHPGRARPPPRPPRGLRRDHRRNRTHDRQVRGLDHHRAARPRQRQHHRHRYPHLPTITSDPRHHHHPGHHLPVPVLPATRVALRSGSSRPLRPPCTPTPAARRIRRIWIRCAARIIG